MKTQDGEQGQSHSRVEWMHKGSFGLMAHYLITPPGASDAERKANFDRIVEGFDLGSFLAQFEATGSDWIIFTIGQGTSYYCSPNRFLDETAPGHTSKRDLILEIAQPIKARGKRMMTYLSSQAQRLSDDLKQAFAWKDGDLSEFQVRYAVFLREYALSFGPLVDGWWLDGCWIKPERFGDWTAWMSALRAGNPDAAVAPSAGPSGRPVTPLQDYLAGETYRLKDFLTGEPGIHISAPLVPSGRFVDGVQWHALLPIDCTFLGSGAPFSYSDKVLFSWVRSCKKAGGAVTINVVIDHKGVLLEKSVAQLSRLAEYLKSETA